MEDASFAISGGCLLTWLPSPQVVAFSSSSCLLHLDYVDDQLGITRSMEGKKRVYKKAMRIPRSTRRRLRMKRITSAKNVRAVNMSNQFNQSAFSSAVTSCSEVPSKPVNML
jgi:hypothetical protein